MVIGIDGRVLQGEEKTGVGVYADRFLRTLFSEHKEHTYIVFTSGVKKNIQLPSTVEHIHLPLPNKFVHFFQFFFRFPLLDRFLERKAGKKIDIFFSPNIHFTSLSKQTPHALFIHDLSFILYPEYYGILRRIWHTCTRYKKQIQEAKTLFVPSESTKQDLVRVCDIDEAKVHVLYPGLTLDIIEEDKSIDAPENFFLCVGSIEPRKNIDGVVAAYIDENFFSKGYELVIVGPYGWGSTRMYKQLQHEQGIHVVGYISDAQKKYLYTRAVALVYPSFYEGFGLPILEAMQTKTPIVTSPISSMPEVAKEHAVYVDPSDVADIRRGMIEVLTQPTPIQQDMSQFSWKKTADIFIQTLC